LSPQGYTLDSLRADVCAMATPRSECISVLPGPVTSEIVAQLDGRDFDQAPVEDYTDRGGGYPGYYIVGLIPRERLHQLADSGEELRTDDGTITYAEVTTEDSLGKLLDIMVEHSAVVVKEPAYPKLRTVGPYWSQYGMLTRSDLNKHPLRAPIYTLLAHLETELARLMVHCYSEAQWNKWVSELKEENRARVLEYWQSSKKQGVDIGPVAGATLPDLLNIVAGDADMLERLRYPSRNAFERLTGRLAGLRNNVMHPARPLVGKDPDTCRCLKEGLSAMVELSKRLEAANP